MPKASTSRSRARSAAATPSTSGARANPGPRDDRGLPDLRAADSITAKLHGKWARENDGSVFVVGVQAGIYLPFEKSNVRLHEFRVLYFADTELEARLHLMGWKFFAQKHKIPIILPVQSESLARLGACDFVPTCTNDDLAKWVNPGGRWDGKEKRWHRQRQAARWHQ